jgi:hypothetical protein
MNIIGLAAVPNQTISLNLEDSFYELTFKVANLVMQVDISRDNEILVQGQRCSPGAFLIPYKYLEKGNFFLDTQDGDYPDYTQFGVTQTLYFFTDLELEEIRADS